MLDTRYAFDNAELYKIINENINIFVPDGIIYKKLNKLEKYLVEDRVLLLILLYEY